jgi:type II secretory pathway component PulF
MSLLCFAILAIYLVLGYRKPGMAFATVPISVGLVWYLTFITDTQENLFVMVPTIFIGTLVVVAATGWDRRSRRWFHWGAWYLLIGIVTILLMGVVLAGFGVFAAGYALAAVFLCSVVLICASLIHHLLTNSRRTAVNVFSTLAAIMRQNLPLPMALDCAAIGAEYGTATVLLDIKRWLVQGCSLADALGRGYPRCPSGRLAMVAAGERIGQAPAALAAIEADVRSQTVEPAKLRPIHPFYPAFVVVVILFLTLGLMTFVIPQFASMLCEIADGRLPVATRILIRITMWLRYSPFGIVAIVLAILIVKFRFWYRILRGRLHHCSVLLWPRDLLAWRLPLVRRFEWDRCLVQTLELLRISLAAGCPVNDAIRSALELDVNRWFRRRLRCWLARVERGEDIAQSARGCGLGRAVAWAFDACASAESTPAILEMLESHHRSLYAYRMNVTRYILWPVGILLLGLMVGFVAYSVFSPAVALINAMALNVYP